MPPAAAVDCFPACRPGFFCYQGACRSACNPPCLAGEVCQDDGQCVVGEGPPPPPPADEVPPPGPPPPGGLMVSDDGETAPPGFHFEMQRRKGMLIAGPVLLGVGYFISAFYGLFGYAFAGLGSTSRTSWIAVNRGTYLVNFIPVAGPLVAQLMFVGSAGYRGDGIGRTFEFGYVVVVTALQATGLALTILGIPSRQVLVEDRRAEADAKDPPGLRWTLAPTAPGAPMGFSLLGTF